MPNKPTTVPTLDTNQTNRTVPASSKVTDGFVLNDILPASNVNYLWGWAGDWLTWLNATFGDGTLATDLQFLGTLLELPTGNLTLTAGDLTLTAGDAAIGGTLEVTSTSEFKDLVDFDAVSTDDGIRGVAGATIMWALTREGSHAKLEAFSQVQIWTSMGSGIGSGTVAATFDASQNTILAGTCQATLFKSTQSIALPFTGLGGTGDPSTFVGISGSFGYVETTTGEWAIPLNLPRACTVTGVSIRLLGGSSHDFNLTLRKRKQGTLAGTGGTSMGTTSFVGNDISSANGSVRSISTISDGAIAADDAAWLTIENLDATSLFIYAGEITITLDDVTTGKAG